MFLINEAVIVYTNILHNFYIFIDSIHDRNIIYIRTESSKWEWFPSNLTFLCHMPFNKEFILVKSQCYIKYFNKYFNETCTIIVNSFQKHVDQKTL